MEPLKIGDHVLRLDSQENDSRYFNASCSCGNWRARDVLRTTAREAHRKHFESSTAGDAEGRA